MAIVVKKKFDIQVEDLTPKKVVIEEIRDKNDELEYLKVQIEELKDVKEKNIKLALQVKEFRNKKDEYRNQYNKIVKENIKRDKINKELNIIVLCPFLEMPISLFDCNESCKHKYCKQLYDCNIRIETIKSKFRIP
jgi:pimeloyl-CoA synthetase